MGIISELVGQQSPIVRTNKAAFPGQTAAQAQWQQTFNTPKERQEPPRVRTRYSTSNFSNEESFKRLLQAVRSMAPGGWSDDRWEQSRHFVGMAYIAIHRQCEQMAQADFKVYRKDRKHRDGKVEVEQDHPLVQLLAKPNDEDSFGDLMYQMNLQMDLTGMALTWMVPNLLGKPMELYSIPTSTAIPQPAVNPDFPDGFWRIQPIYPYGPFSSYPSPTTAVGAPIPAQWMIRCKYPHPILRYDGYSPLTALRLHMDELEMIDRSRFYSMRSSINPNAVLQMEGLEAAEPLPEHEVERIREQFEEDHQGPDKHGTLLVSTPGSRLEPWGAAPKDMEYQSGWDQLTAFVLAGFGITKPAAGITEDSAYATLFATLKQLNVLTLDPKCRRIANQLTRRLAPYFNDGDDLVIEIETQRIDDHEIEFQRWDKLAQHKCVTVNEFRRAMDVDETEEEWGEERIGDQPQQEGMPGMPGGGDPAAAAMGGAQTNGVEDFFGAGGQEQQMDDGTSQAPDPGTLNQGSLGPRDGLKEEDKAIPSRMTKRELMVRHELTKFFQLPEDKSQELVESVPTYNRIFDHLGAVNGKH